MKKRHYLLIASTIVAIVYFEPLIMLLGGITLIAAVAALIFADLSPQAQDACEHEITHFLTQLRAVLRKKPKAAPGSVGRRGDAQRVAEQQHEPRGFHPPPGNTDKVSEGAKRGGRDGGKKWSNIA